MVSASFQQTSFLAGEWSKAAQGRKTDPNYQRALSTSLNGMPIETGAWTRRSGFRFLGLTRHGTPFAKLFQFDFSTVQPYQVVMTDGFLRMWAGLGQVIADNPDGYTVLDVSAATPAVVTAANIPATWVGNDTVVFNINSTPCTAPLLCGREFTIKSVDTDAGTFALYDPITDAPIDGATLAYSPPLDGVYNDVVKKIFELATPYTNGEWKDARITNDGTHVTFWHPNFKPQTLALDTAQPFTLTAQAFTDGPYLDINTTTTTLTPSGVSGTINMVASSTVGINGDVGFKTTDVGRHLRFQSGPPAWDGGTAYAKADQVTGSDSNVYQAIKANTAIDPTTDDGTNWIILAEAVTWVWMIITAWVSTLEVTCVVQGVANLSQQTPLILGDTLSSATAQPVWQLGYFSDTTGYPALGAYHDGRLWLGSQITKNRYDGSCSADFFNFCPTAIDGTVSDGNAISDTVQTEEVDAVYWFLSTGDGLLIGTQGSEHRIRASVLDDPLSPNNQQERRVSKFGSKNAEPLLPWGRPVMVQRKGRKLIALRQASATEYDGDNISRFAAQIVSRGIEEIRWQQEPALTMWLRLSDGGLAGCVYRSSAYSFTYSQSENVNDVNFQAFFPVTHAYLRSFVSISTGPNSDGTSNALYAITNQTDNAKPDFNVGHVEYMMPMFDDASQDWASFFVDGGASPCCGREFLVSNGDDFNGVRLYGLTYLNGLTTSVVIGGLDIGDFAVSNGFIDIPFGTPAEFTQAFFEALDNGTDYGDYESGADFVQTASGSVLHPQGSVGMWDDLAQTEYYTSYIDPDTNKAWKFGLTGGMMEYDYTSFDFLRSINATDFNIAPWAEAGGYTVVNGYFVSNSDISNHSQKLRINMLTGERVDYGSSSSHLTPSGTNADDGYAMTFGDQIIGLRAGSQYLVAQVGTSTGGLENEIALMDLDTFLLMIPVNGFADSVSRIDEDRARICPGPCSSSHNMASFFIVGGFSPFTGSDGIGVYWAVYSNGLLIVNKLALLSGADIDPTWTTIGSVSTPYFIAKNNTFIFHVITLDSVTNPSALVCFDPIAGAIKWTVPSTFTSELDPAIFGTFSGDYLYFAQGTLNPTYQKIDIETGTVVSTATWPNGSINANWGFAAKDGGIITLDLANSWAGNPPTMLGTFAQADGVSPPRHMPAKLFIGAAGEAVTSVRTFAFPTSIGLAYTSEGQLLPPDAGQDAGARNGPAFGKKRRLHWFAALLVRTRGLTFGAYLLGKMRPMRLASDGGTPIAAPSLLSDVITTTIDDDYSFKGQIGWKITRPYPATIATVGGYLETMDK